MRLRYLSLFLLILCFTVSVHPVVAQEEQASPDPVTQTLKDRVQKVLDSQDGNVAGIQTQRAASFGFIGTLDKVVGSTLQITTYTGNSRIAELEKTASVTRLGKPISHEEIELNSTIIATGSIDQDETYKIKKLNIVADTIYPTKRQTILGFFTSLSTRSVLFTPVNAQETQSGTAALSTKTLFYDVLGNRIDRKLIKSGEQILVVLPQSQEATASALRIYKMSAEQSALPKATPLPLQGN